MQNLNGNDAIRASRNFTVMQVRALVAAADSQSFTKAAAQLQVTQPTLSRCVKELEDAIGVSLFVRSRNGVMLSRAGEAFLPPARRLLEAYESTLAFMTERRASRHQTLRLAADASLAPVIMSTLLGYMQQEFNNTELQIAAMGSEEALNQVLSRGAEMALCGEMTGHPDLRYTPVLRAQVGLIIPAGCEVPTVVRSLHDLNGIPTVRLADCTPVTRVLRCHGVDFPAYFGSPIVFTCLSAAFDLMREQKAVAVATGIGASLRQAQGMKFLPLPQLLPSVTVYLTSLRQLVHDDFMELLRELVIRSVHDSPWHPSVLPLNRLARDTVDAKTASPNALAHQGDQPMAATAIATRFCE